METAGIKIGKFEKQQRKRRKMSIERKKSLIGYVFISPFIVGTFLFFFYPIIRSVILSLSAYTTSKSIDDMKFNGLGHYFYAFTEDVQFIPKFIEVVSDTLIITPLIVIFSLILSVCINKKFKGRGAFRTIFILPFVLGSGIIFKYLLFSGSSAEALELARGIIIPQEIQTYLGEDVAKLIGIFLEKMTLVFWKSGLQILLYLSGLQSISKSLYESAKCDSATEWEMFWYITIPVLSPVILINVVYTIIDSFSDTNNAMIEYFYLQAFEFVKFDYAAAITWIYYGVIFIIIGIVFLFAKQFVFYSTDKAGKVRKR